ncbi:uncharacterized protein LOC112600024 [Melanaphis sacchari]|uniref:uncharacterized protein LOC112600024 n=1 Tax=Melanaphis sacchari TaxID=742174 RepID=UPI000DC14C6F|nr:uncharacterized protein LOC112600024 [Melanaphis sacchari]
MNHSNSIKLTPEDDYVSFMVYLRTNNVWKTVNDVFRMLNETRSDDPIEFFRANVKIDNSDNRTIEEIHLKIAEAEKNLKILRYDKIMLTANLDLLDKTIRVNRKPNLGVRSTIDHAENDNETISETLPHSEHVL